MATRREPVRSRDVQGLKYLDMLLPLLDQLHEVGCQRDKTGNRRLHYDQYCLLVLLCIFSPVLRRLAPAAVYKVAHSGCHGQGLCRSGWRLSIPREPQGPFWQDAALPKTVPLLQTQPETGPSCTCPFFGRRASELQGTEPRPSGQ